MSNIKPAEQVVIEWLEANLTDYPVSTQRPKTLPSKFAILRRDGGEREHRIMDVADFQLEIYDKESEFNCAVQASDICDLIEDELAHSNKNIAKAKVYGASNVGDERIQYYSYLIDFSVWYKRSE